MKLYHCSTPKKAARYFNSKKIIAPVRGFTTLLAAMEWARLTRRDLIFEIEANQPHKLPDHHNKYGEAWWNDGDVVNFECVFEAKVPINKEQIRKLQEQALKRNE